jgi:hypothetical protein
MKKYIFVKRLAILAAAVVVVFIFTACSGNTAELDKLKQERDTAITERNTAQTERDTAKSERDTAVSAKDSALNELAFYTALVDAFPVAFQSQIDSFNRQWLELSEIAPELTELMGLITDVLQNAYNGEITADTAESVRAVFGALFVEKFDALYEKIHNNETGYTSADGYSVRYSNNQYSNNDYKQYDITLYAPVGGYSHFYISYMKVNDEFSYLWGRSERSYDTAHIYMTGDTIAEIDIVKCYTNGVLHYRPYTDCSIYMQDGELLAVEVYKVDYINDAEYVTFAFEEGIYGYSGEANLRLFVGDSSLFLDMLTEDEFTITINGGIPTAVNMTDFMSAAAALEIDMADIFNDVLYDGVLDIYLTDGFGGLIDTVNEKIQIMELIMAKILELPAA